MRWKQSIYIFFSYLISVRLLIRGHFIVCLNFYRLRVVPRSLSPSCETRKKPARKKWPREILVARRIRISRGHFFLVSQDGLSERGTTRSLKFLNLSDQEPVSRRSQKVKVPGLSRKRPLGRICMVNRTNRM